MLKPTLSRVRPTRTYEKYLRNAWRPPPTDEQFAWSRAAATYLKHNPNLRPDAYALLSDLRASRFTPDVDTHRILEWVNNDQRQRFQLVTDLERYQGNPEWHKTTYIRIREDHSVPDVSITTTRVRIPGQIRSLIYTTAPENWSLIERRGLQPNSYLSNLLRQSAPLNPNFIYFPQHLTTLPPSEFTSPSPSPLDKPLVQLHIRLDVAAAMNAGIKFFMTKTKQVIATGLTDRSISPAFFKDVFVVSLTREILHNSNAIVHRPRQ